MEQEKEKLRATGPENYSPNEVRIEQLQQQVAQAKAQIALLRAEVSTRADAMMNSGKTLAEKFAAIPDGSSHGRPTGCRRLAEAVARP